MAESLLGLYSGGKSTCLIMEGVISELRPSILFLKAFSCFSSVLAFLEIGLTFQFYFQFSSFFFKKLVTFIVNESRSHSSSIFNSVLCLSQTKICHESKFSGQEEKTSLKLSFHFLLTSLEKCPFQHQKAI